MELDRLNRWLTLGANLGVLFGLALLLVELKQSNTIAISQIEQTRSDSLREWRQQWVTSEYIAPLLVRISDALEGVTGPTDTQAAMRKLFASLEDDERERMFVLVLDSYWDYENVYAQYQRGLISEDYWSGRIAPAIVHRAPRWLAVGQGELPGGRPTPPSAAR